MRRQQPVLVGAAAALALALTAATPLTPTLAGSTVGSGPTAGAGGAPLPTPAQRRWQEGQALLAAGKLDAAAAAFADSRRLGATGAEPLLGLAEVARLRGDKAAVDGHLRRAVAEYPKEPAAHIAFARYLHGERRFGEARAALETAIRLAPDAVAPHVDLATLTLRALGDARRAEPLYRRAIALDPTHAGAHYGLGASLVALGQPRPAADAFSRAGELDASNPLPPLALAEALASVGDLDGAQAAAERANQLVPGHAGALLLKGEILLRRGDGEGALAAFTAAAAADADSGAADLGLARVHHAAGRTAEAERHYRAAIAKNANDALALNNLASLLTQRPGQGPTAVRLAERAVALAPQQADFLDTLGWAQRAMGQLAQAEANLSKAAAAAPRSAAIHYHLGVVLAERNRPQAARQALETALRLDPEFAEAAAAKLTLAKLGR